MIERLHPTITMIPDASGNFCAYPSGGFAAEAWVYPSRTPTPPLPPVMVWIIAQKSEGLTPEVMRHSGERFRSPTGADKGLTVWRWALLKLNEDVTSVVPGPVPPSSTGNWLQDIVNLLTKFYKWSDILNARDRSPYYNPEEGAPE